MPDSLDEDAIKTAAESPFSAETDGTKVVQHPLSSLIEADRYIESKKTARRSFPVMRTIMEPPSAV